MRLLKKVVLSIGLAILAFLVFVSAAEAEENETFVLSENAGEISVSQKGKVVFLGSSSDVLAYLSDKPGAVIEGDDVVVQDAFTLPAGTFTLTGKWSFEAPLHISENAKCYMQNAEITLSENAYLHVKGGFLSLASSAVTAQKDAVLLDYSESGVFEMESGSISAGETAVLSTHGTVKILGGILTSEDENAIVSYGTVFLSGSPRISAAVSALKLSEPPILSIADVPFTGEVTILSLKTYALGDFSIAAYQAEPGMENKITFLDANAQKIPLTYVSKSEYSAETSFLAVLIPYTMKVYSDGELVEEKEAFGFTPSDISFIPEKKGFSFVGWVFKGTSIPFSGEQKQNLEIEAQYKLNPPLFHITSEPFIYDAMTHDFTFSSLTHPLADVGIFAFVWTKDDEILASSSEVLKVKNVSDSGRYQCTITFTYGKESVSVKTPTVPVSILPMKVAIPVSASYDYDEEEHKGAVPPCADYRILSNTVGRDAGQYPYSVTLTDSQNTVWEDGSTENKILYYEIKKSENVWLSPLKAGVSYENREPNILAQARWGKVNFWFAKEDSQSFSENLPNVAGTYRVKAVVVGNDNYFGLESETLVFEMKPLSIVGLRINTMPNKVVYSAFEVFECVGLSAEVTYADGSVESINANEIGYQYQKSNCFQFGDTYITATLENAFAIIPVTVNKARYNMAGISFSDGEKTYNGQWQTLKITGELPIGLDLYPLCVSYEGGGVHAGMYEISAVFSTESQNYEIPPCVFSTLKILPCPIDIEYADTVLYYNGSVQYPQVKCLGVFHEEVPYLFTGGGCDAGTYTASLSLLSTDYLPIRSSFSYEIMKAEFDLSSLRWEGGPFVFDGNEKSVFLSGLPVGLSVGGYVNAVGTKAGDYHASASFTYDTSNYEPVLPICFDWVIQKAEYDLSTLLFDCSSVVFDGLFHTPLFLGVLPTGKDGSVLCYSFENALMHAGSEQMVKVVFSADSENYEVPDPLWLSMTVYPLPITVSWADTTFVYNGYKQIPTATGSVEVRVFGNGIYVGNYTASAVSVDPDYVIENDKIEYTITKAQNEWLVAFSIENCFEGGELSYSGTPKKGDFTVAFYSDFACQHRVEELTPGHYYAVATVSDLLNYELLLSDPQPFEVIEVLPIQLSAVMKTTSFSGGKTLRDEDVTIELLYNNGKSSVLPLSSVDVQYEKAGFLSAKDESVVLSYQGLICTLFVTVEKNTVTIPSFEKIYSGQEQTVILSGDEPYVIEENARAVSVGNYAVKVRLKDPENYIFGGTDDTVVLTDFRISPRPLTIKISDVTEYRDGVRGEPHYEVVSGELLPADILLVTYLFEDGVSAVTENANYNVTVLEGKIIKTKALSEDGKKRTVVLSWTCLLLLVLLFTYRMLRKRKAEKPMKEEKTASGNLGLLPPGKSKSEVPMALGGLHPFFALNTTESSLSEKRMREILSSVDPAHADQLLTDRSAKHLLNRKREVIKTFGKRKCIVNLDVIDANFENGSRVDINVLKAKGILPYDCGHIKILGRGSITKQLFIYADEFSLQAVKMIALTGGMAVRITTVEKKFSSME